MKKKIISILLALLILSATCTCAFAVVEQSAQYYVADYADVLSDTTEENIISLNANLESYCEGAQIVIVTVDYMDGMYADEYAIQLFNDWGVGDATANNGMLFLFAVKRRLRSGCVAARAAERHGLNDGRRKILRAVIERAVVRQDTADHDARARHGGDCGGRRLPPALFTFVPIHIRPSLPGGTPRRTPRPSCTRAGDSSRAA